MNNHLFIYSKKWTLNFLVILSIFGKLKAQGPIEQQVTEDDWSLPEWVQKSENSGIIFYDYDYVNYPETYENIVTVGYRWKDLNPQEGVYNWSLIYDDLNHSEKMYIRMGLSDTIHVPQWIFDKYPDLKDRSFFVHEYLDIFEVESDGYFIPIWDPGVMNELNHFWNAFKAEGFQSNPKLHHLYVPGAYTWGEYARVEDDILENDGLTPQDYVDFFKELIDMFAHAFEGYEYKLVFTGGDILEKIPSEYWRDTVGRQPGEYVVLKGLGYRTGMLEKFNFVMTELPNYGHSLLTEIDKNYIVTDDFNPMIADTLRVTANENEVFCYNNNPCDYYHVKMSVLKQLQMRHRYSYSNNYAYQIDDNIHHYFQLTAGKQYYDSPDAWCALREGKDIYQWWANYPDRKDFYFSNWERWLYQREVEPDGKTQNVYYIDNEPYYSHNGDSFEAKSTNISENQNYIYFDVDDKFMFGGPYEIQIKVTYLDNFNGQWELQYQSTAQTYQPLTVTNSNDNLWKTVTFDINNDFFTNEQNGGNDFRLFNGGNHDLTVRFVRVIKTKDPLLMGLEESYLENQIKIYPNPANDLLYIQFPNKINKQTPQVFDLSGRRILNLDFNQKSNIIELDISNLQPGVYILRIEDQSIRFVKK